MGATLSREAEAGEAENRLLPWIDCLPAVPEVRVVWNTTTIVGTADRNGRGDKVVRGAKSESCQCTLHSSRSGCVVRPFGGFPGWRWAVCKTRLGKRLFRTVVAMLSR